jgi:hypothetical protein
LVIVVVGVFIGIQVANWNESRLEAKRSHDFLERISSDLEKELASIDRDLWLLPGAAGLRTLAEGGIRPRAVGHGARGMGSIYGH